MNFLRKIFSREPQTSESTAVPRPAESRWTKLQCPTEKKLVGIWGSGTDSIFVVSTHAIFKYDGSEWQLAHEAKDQSDRFEFLSIHGSGPDNIFAVGGTPLPTPAAPMEPQYEDNFARPVTTAQDIDMQMNNTGCDGLGPMEVWMSNAAFVDSAGNESFALLPGSSGIDYVPLPNNLHSFNEIEFQPWCRTLIEDPNGIPNPPNNSDCAATPLNYRVDIVNRMVMQSNSCGSGTVAYLYWAQLRYEPDWAADPTTEPTIRVFRTGPPDPNECPPSEIGTELLSSTLVSTLCPAADTSGLKDGSPIIFRIDVGPSVLGGDTPKVVTEIGWDCSNGACAQSCTIGDDLAEQMVDSALSGDNPLRTNLGTMGAFSHHWDTRGNAFRTGSDPPD